MHKTAAKKPAPSVESFERLKALIHYVCAKSAEHPKALGRIKLNKVPWYADTIAFALYGKSITGERYIKRQFGPVPAKFVPAQKQLAEEGKIVEPQPTIYGNRHEFTSIAAPDTSMFSKEDMDVIHQAYDHVCLHHSAKSVSAETHDHVWALAEIGENIPLQTVFSAEFAEVTEEDIAWANEELSLALAA